MIRELYVFSSNGPSPRPTLINHIQKRKHNNDGVEDLVQNMAFFLARSNVEIDFERMVMPSFSVFYCTISKYTLFVIANVAESTEKIRKTMNKLKSLVSRYTEGGKPLHESQAQMELDMKDALQEILKVVFIGPAKVGKSSCRMLLNYDDPTIIHTATLFPTFLKLELEDEVIIWDSPGQEGFETWWPKLVKEADVIAIVCDSKIENLGKSADIVQQCRVWEPNARLIAIANKQDSPEAVPPENVAEFLGIPSYPLIAIDTKSRDILLKAIKEALSRDEN